MAFVTWLIVTQILVPGFANQLVQQAQNAAR